MPRSRKLTTIAVLAVAAVLVAVASAGAGSGSGDADAAPPGLARAIAAQERNEDRLLSRAGVVGTAVGLDGAGRPVVKVLTRRRGLNRLPAKLDGVAVEAVVTGALAALHHRPGHGGGPGGGGGSDDGGDGDGGSAPELAATDVWPRPVPIGVSTGNRNECAAGTIGARVADAAGNVYALSNNHVYARENEAAIGEEVLQAGRYDTGCAYDPANRLGNLADFVPMVFDGATPNRVDAAIASTTTALLGDSTPPSGYGTPASEPVDAALGEAVQKFGRTTALTTGVVTGLNATVRVGYGSGTALFVDQILVERKRPGFIKAGDSGSLLVTSPGAAPVGLLFAGNGNGKLGIANDIDDVLAELGVAIDVD